MKLFFSVSIRMLPGEISIFNQWTCKLDHPSQCVWTSSSLLRSWIEQKGMGRRNLPFLFLPASWAGTPVLFCPRGECPSGAAWWAEAAALWVTDKRGRGASRAEKQVLPSLGSASSGEHRLHCVRAASVSPASHAGGGWEGSSEGGHDEQFGERLVHEELASSLFVENVYFILEYSWFPMLC